MSLDSSPLRAASSPIQAIVVCGGAGALFLLILAAVGAADAGPAMLSAALLVALTAVLAMGVRRRRVWEEMLASGGEGEGAPPYQLALETLPDPVMLLSQGKGETAAPRYVFANAAARELFRIGRPDGLLHVGFGLDQRAVAARFDDLGAHFVAGQAAPLRCRRACLRRRCGGGGDGGFLGAECRAGDGQCQCADDVVSGFHAVLLLVMTMHTV